MFLVILLLPRPDFTSRLLNGFKPMGIQALLPQICRIILTLKPINKVVKSMLYLIASEYLRPYSNLLNGRARINPECVCAQQSRSGLN